MNFKYIFIFLGVVSIGIAQAQENLSLSDAIKRGLERNYDILIESKNVEVAGNNNNWGEAGRYPTVNLTLNQNNNLQDNVKTAFPTSTQGKTSSQLVNPGVNLNWTLFNGFKINISKYRLETLQRQSEGNASVVISNTIQSIILGYYLAVLEKERLSEFQKQLKLSTDKYEYVKVKSEIGSAVSSDLLLEEANYLGDSVNYLNQQLSYRNALRNLNVLLAEDDLNIKYNLSDDLKVVASDYTLEQLKSNLESNNIDLKNQYLSQAIIKHDLQTKKSDKYPTVSLNAGFSDNRQSFNLSKATFFTGDGFTSGPNSSLNSVTDTYFANFTVSFTLFNGGKINRAIQNAIMQEDIENLKTTKMKQSLNKDLIEAFDQYIVRKQLHEINSRRLNATQTNLNISEEKFKNGTINSFDYRIVQNNYLTSAIQRLQSLYNLIDSEVSMMRLTGGIIETYK